jgi:hypothetical protein
MNALASSPTVADRLVGDFRTFGPEGPVYEILGKVDEKRVHIVVVESGEELDYEVSEAIQDPEAR